MPRYEELILVEGKIQEHPQAGLQTAVYPTSVPVRVGEVANAGSTILNELGPHPCLGGNQRNYDIYNRDVGQHSLKNDSPACNTIMQQVHRSQGRIAEENLDRPNTDVMRVQAMLRPRNKYQGFAGKAAVTNVLDQVDLYGAPVQDAHKDTLHGIHGKHAVGPLGAQALLSGFVNL